MKVKRGKENVAGKIFAILCLSTMILIAVVSTVVNFKSPNPTTPATMPVALPMVAQVGEEGEVRVDLPDAPVVPPTGQNLSPNSTKIDDAGVATSTTEQYAGFWAAVEAQAVGRSDYDRDGLSSPKEIEAFKQAFVTALGYQLDPDTGSVTAADGTEVSVETLTCYFNGYVPERPYIKPNCSSK